MADDVPVSMLLGETRHVSTRIKDKGRNVKRVTATLSDASGESVEVGSFELHGRAVPQDEFDLRVPIVINADVPIGAGDLTFQAEDDLGHHSAGEAVPILIEPTELAPLIGLESYTHRMPAGSTVPLKLQISHLMPLQKIEISVSGPGLADDMDDLVIPDIGLTSFSQEIAISSNGSAMLDEQIMVTVRAYDIGNQSSSQSIVFEIGEWGENEFLIAADAVLTEAMRFSNISVQGDVLGVEQTQLSIQNEGIPVNRLVIEDGATVLIDGGVGEIEVHDQLVIESGGRLSVATNRVGSPVDLPKLAGHGGDGFIGSREVSAYGSFRNPEFPGSGDGGGGVLTLRVGQLTLNGVISANADAPDPVPDAEPVDPRASGYQGTIPAPSGGSISIHTNQVSGSGTLEANGSNGEQSLGGAGGRIALYYDDLNRSNDEIFRGFSWRVEPGDSGNLFSASGSGTVFIKRSDQSYGSLYVENNNPFIHSTTLRSVGDFPVASVTRVLGADDMYEITIVGEDLPLRDEDNWEPGLSGLFVQLLADSGETEPLRIVRNTETSITVYSEADPVLIGEMRVRGVVPLDYLHLGDRTELISRDTISVADFRFRSGLSIAGVAGFETEKTETIGSSYLGGEYNDGFYVGHVDADQLILESGQD